MAQCRVCGNKIEQPCSILIEGEQQDFDCFACARQALAPTCMHCGCGLKDQAYDQQHVYYCCDACAEGCETTVELS